MTTLGLGAGAAAVYTVSNKGFSGSVKRTAGGSSSQDIRIRDTKKGMNSLDFICSHEVK
jgi:hypothetical protein